MKSRIAKALKYHKNTMISVVAMLIAGTLYYKWLKGEITLSELGVGLGAAAGMATTIIGFISPDGKNEALRKENRQELIAEIKAQLKAENEDTKNNPDCACGGECRGVLKEDADKL